MLVESRRRLIHRPGRDYSKHQLPVDAAVRKPEQKVMISLGE